MGLFFMLVHFCVLYYFSNVFPLCFFIFLVDDTHILNLTHVVAIAFDHFVSRLASMGLAI